MMGSTWKQREVHMRRAESRVLVAAIVALLWAASSVAHEITVKGTVAGIEATRIQVKTGEEKSGESPAWYSIDASTKVKRGDKVVRLAEAKIRVAERVVLIIDHPAQGPMKTLEIRLAAQ